MPIEALIEDVAERLVFPERRRIVAKVLLADSDLASRLTLKSVLGKAGYAVEGAATAAEAISRLDANQFQLVLADLRSESDDAGPSVLAYARQKDYRPATALITLAMSEVNSRRKAMPGADRVIQMSNEDVSNLLANVAELIGLRADRRMRRASQS
jgi:CheY-like chemotaxis protein